MTGDRETLKMIREAAKLAVKSEIESIKRERLVQISEKLGPEELEPEELKQKSERFRKRRPALVEDEETLEAIR